MHLSLQLIYWLTGLRSKIDYSPSGARLRVWGQTLSLSKTGNQGAESLLPRIRRPAGDSCALFAHSGCEILPHRYTYYQPFLHQIQRRMEYVTKLPGSCIRRTSLCKGSPLSFGPNSNSCRFLGRGFWGSKTWTPAGITGRHKK